MAPAFNPLRGANCEIFADFRRTYLHSGRTDFLTVLKFAVPEHYFQLIRSIRVAEGEKDVGYYVGLLVRVVFL